MSSFAFASLCPLSHEMQLQGTLCTHEYHTIEGQTLIVQIQTGCLCISIWFFNGFLLLVVLSNLTLKLVWLILVGVVAAAAPVGALEGSLTRARRSWGWSRSLGESTAWSRCSRPWKSQPFRPRLRKVKDLMKGSPAHPRAVKREQAMMTGNGFSAAKLPSLKNAASNLGEKELKATMQKIFWPVHEAGALWPCGRLRKLDGGEVGDGDGGVEELNLLSCLPLALHWQCGVNQPPLNHLLNRLWRGVTPYVLSLKKTEWHSV